MNANFKIQVLGYGGAFDFQEGHSAFYVQAGNHQPFLIDSGSTVLPKLKQHLTSTWRFVEENTIIITHTHEDHVGSLSNNIYARYFGGLMVNQKAATKIIAQPNVANLIKNKLLIVNNHPQEQFSIHDAGVYSDLGVSIAFVDTTNYHFSNFPTSGIILRDIHGAYLVISGDINIPIFGLIQEQYPEVWEEMSQFPERVCIFHDVTIYESPNNPHCFYKLLTDYKEKFPYIWPYHHDKGQMEALNQVGWVNLLGDYLDRTLEFKIPV